MGSAGSLFANRAIARCEAAWALSTVGTWSFTIVFALYAYYEHGPAGVGLAVAVRMLPTAILADLPSAVRSRWSDRTVLVASAAVRFLALEGIAIVATLEGPFALLLALAGVFEVARVAHEEVRAQLVLEAAQAPQDLGALSTAGMVTSAGLLLGAVASAVIVIVVSLHAAFAVAGVPFALLALFAWRLPVGGGPPRIVRRAAAEGAGSRLRHTARSLAAHPWLRLRMGLFSAAALVDATLDLVFVIVALEILHAGDSGVGWLRAAFALGAVVGAGLAAVGLRGGRLAGGVAAGLALAGLPLAVLVAWPSIVPALVMVALLGGGYALFDSSMRLLMRRLSEAEPAVHATSAEGYVYPLVSALGAGVGAWLVLDLGERTAVVIAGMVLPAVAALALLPLLRAERTIAIPSRVLARIRTLPLVASLPIAAIENLAIGAGQERFDEGATIVGRDEPGEKLYVIEDGAAGRSSGGGFVERLGPGSVVGDAAILRNDKQRSQVTALTPVSALTITRPKFISSVGGPEPESQAEPAPPAGALEPAPAA